MKSVADSAPNGLPASEQCAACGATARVEHGLCASCLLRQALAAEEAASAEAFTSVLAEAEVPDRHWRLGNYEILEEIGRGGMGVIYRARQRHSGRIVALKRLLTYQADSHEALVRFRREAEAAAQLDHPNILPLYEVGESEDGLPFFSMKLASGGSLRAAASKLQAQPNECVRLIAKVARALDHAHRAGLLHRDLQPGNILLDARDEPMVSDFGLAKWMTGESDLTRSLTSFGTPGYIAPEQAESAGGGLTPAADIYSLGAILFYLLANRPPFTGANVLSVLRQAAASPAPRLRSIAPALDRDLETICARCLEREPAARYRSASAMAEDLERWLDGLPIMARPVGLPARAWRWSRRNPLLAGAALVCFSLGGLVLWLLGQPRAAPRSSPPPEKSIAVLPFANLSADQENSYFAGGVQDEILSDLARIADLKVISRTSTRQYEAKPRNLRQIGQDLGVAHLVEGSVQRTGHHLRIHAQLIDARTDAHLWAQTYDRDVADLFAIQSEIARTIAAQLQAKISKRESAAIAQPATSDLIANDLYLEALALEAQLPDRPSALKATRLLEQAVARDPRFVLAYCALSRMHCLSFGLGYDHAAPRLAMADAALKKAGQIAPEGGEIHLQRALYLGIAIRDYDRARAELELARRVLPNNATVYFHTGIIDRRQGRWTEALMNFQRAVELDPRNIDTLVEAASTFSSMRSYPEAAQLFRRAVAVAPSNYYARVTGASLPFLERADLRPLRAELNAILAEDPGAAPKIADPLFECAVYERDEVAAERALAAIPPEGLPLRPNLMGPREWYVGFAAGVFHRPEIARAAFASSRDILKKQLAEQPDNASAWSILGRVEAALGHKDEAIKAGRRACELLPLSREATSGVIPLTDLARIFAWVGEKELALQHLATSAQNNLGVSYGHLKRDPAWDPLRGDPRFDKIVASLAPKL